MANRELQRLEDERRRAHAWKRWGPYLSERQWSTVREDYSPGGDTWSYFPHDHARSRAYRWGEDGLLGICDRQCRLCFALTVWNERDPILKERLYVLTGQEGNHGEDVKELYWYLDSTPTHSYLRAAYRYPQREFPYEQLIRENRARDRFHREFDLEDTGIFADGRFFDIVAEYAKGSPGDLAIRITAINHGPEPARLHLLPTVWFRNTWSWGRTGEAYWGRPSIVRTGEQTLLLDHSSLGRYQLDAESAAEWLFTENETNLRRLYDVANATPWVKDAFHEYLIHGKRDAVSSFGRGTKAAAAFVLDVPPHGGSRSVRLRLTAAEEVGATRFGREIDQIFAKRIEEADAFYAAIIPKTATAEERRVARQAYAGLGWSKQFYHYIVDDWLEGDPSAPAPPPGRKRGRNREWKHLYCRDVISMPDKWEYPWFAAWDLAFHVVAFARIDPDFAKEQLTLFTREWYMHPNGQLPAYEWDFGDVNPPVHAWAAWRVYKIAAQAQGDASHRDRTFLCRIFQKMLLNFTWWVNRKDDEGNNLFSGGFLGLDNVGVFDRSRPLPSGGYLEQADGTAWMAFYCATMLSMALELAREDPAFEDMASKFFEHFVAITDAMNGLGGTGLWDETDGFYYDLLVIPGRTTMPLRLRSMVGVIPLFAAAILDDDVFDELPGFAKRTRWFLENRKDLARHIAYMEEQHGKRHPHRLLAIPSRDRLVRVLRYLLDEDEFLSPHGIRSLSRVHDHRPYSLHLDGGEYTVRYVPGESDNAMFGGNSNWRGPIWMPMNYLLIEALERYDLFYGETLKVECPTGSGRMMTLREVARELASRLTSIFLPGPDGARPFEGDGPLRLDPTLRERLMFHEYFDGDTGRGCGATHQTGWTALVARLVEDISRDRR